MTKQYVTANYFEPGGDRTVINGRLIVDGQMDRTGGLVLPAATLQSAIIQHYHIVPAAVSAVAVLAATALTADVGGQDITVGITNPDVPRNVTAKGNAAGIVGNVVVTGTAINGSPITDTIALNGAAEVAGVVAFKTVTKVHLPPEVNAGTDTVSVGAGGIFGLPHVILAAGCMLKSLFDLAADAGATATSANIEGNTYDPVGAVNGAKPLDLWYLV